MAWAFAAATRDPIGIVRIVFEAGEEQAQIAIAARGWSPVQLEHGGAIRARRERELRHSDIERANTTLEERRRFPALTASHATRSPRHYSR